MKWSLGVKIFIAANIAAFFMSVIGLVYLS